MNNVYNLQQKLVLMEIYFLFLHLIRCANINIKGIIHETDKIHDIYVHS